MGGHSEGGEIIRYYLQTQRCRTDKHWGRPGSFAFQSSDEYPLLRKAKGRHGMGECSAAGRRTTEVSLHTVCPSMRHILR